MRVRPGFLSNIRQWRKNILTVTTTKMISYLEKVEQNNFKKICRAKHVLSRVEGTPRRKVTLRVISTEGRNLS
jgi:hypothetical protein